MYLRSPYSVLFLPLVMVPACGDGGGSGGGTATSTTVTASATGTTDATETSTGPGTSGGSASASSGDTSSGPVGSSGSAGGSTSAGSSGTTGTTGGSGSAGSSGATAGSGSAGGSGTTGGGVPDSDGDGLPDPDDPFPNDPDKPGDTALPYRVYAHTANTLFTMDVDPPYTIAQVGPFSYDASPGSMTDIAIDRFGVLYGVTFDDLFVCNAATAECWWLADLPQFFNGLTLVPPGVLEPDDDTLIAIANSGDWYRADLMGNTVTLTPIGGYGPGYSNDGDVFSIQGVGTYGATNKQGVANTVIVEADPMTGSVVSDLATLPVSSVYGLAGWEGDIFAFDASGDVLRVDPMTAQVTTIQTSPYSWWGAGVATVLPQ